LDNYNTTTQSAKRGKRTGNKKDAETGDGTGSWLQAVGAGDSKIKTTLKYSHIINLEGVFCTGADFLIGPRFFLCVPHFCLRCREVWHTLS
jgi:hypothetical protein